MRRLLLLRHAKAARPAGVEDIERPLAKRGRKAASLMGAYLAEQGLEPDLALVSPARRTRETWDLARRALGDVPTRFEERLYGSEAEDVLAVLRGVEPDVSSILLIGHNPGIEDAARLLVGSAEPSTHARILLAFPTAALAVIACPAGGWTELTPGSGRLERVVTPESLGDQA